MELLIMFAIGAAVLGLIYLIVREPKEVQLERERRVEDFKERWKQRELEEQQSARVNAGIPRAPMPEVKKPKPEKHVDKPAPRSYSSSSSGSSSRSSSRSSDDSWASYSSYSSWGGDSGSSSSSSSCDSSSSSSSSSSCD